MKYIDFLVRCN